MSSNSGRKWTLMFYCDKYYDKPDAIFIDSCETAINLKDILLSKCHGAKSS